MDINIVKKESDHFLDTEIIIKTEPLDDSSKFSTDTFNFPGTDHQQHIKNEIIEVNIKSEYSNIKDEVFCNEMEVGELGEVFVKEENNIELIEEHLLKNAEDRSHESIGFGESIRQNQMSCQEKLIHANEKTFKYDECDKMCSGKLDLFISGVKPFKCSICEKSFLQKSQLKSHLLVHTGEKPYKCDICNKLFSHKGNLISHMITHTGEKLHKCHVCEKLFSYHSSLKKHMVIHTGEKPYKCDICEKLFTHQRYLTSHMLTHTGEKPYKCNICEKLFSCKRNLNRHMLVHTVKKLHKCDICKKLFSRKDNLSKHMLTHTG